MRRLISVLLFAILAGSAASQTPATPDWSKVINKGLDWIVANGGTTYKLVPVEFYVAIPADQMASYAVKLNVAGDPSKTLAIHSCSQHTMYLNASYDFNNNFIFQSVL